MERFNSRKLSDNEYSYQLMNEVSDPSFYYIIEFKKLDIRYLERKLNSFFKNYIELNCEINKKRYTYKETTINFIKLITNYETNYFTFIDEIKKTNNKELFQVYYSGFNVIFRINHSLMDGKGFTLFINEFFQSITTDKKCIQTDSYISDLDFIKGLQPIKEKRNLKYSNKLGNLSFGKNDNILIRKMTINHNMNFVMQRIISILSSFFENDNLTYIIPSSIRNYRDDIITFSNLSEPLYFRCKKTDNWLELAKKMKIQQEGKENLNIKNINYGGIINVNKKIFNLVVKASEKYQFISRRFLTAGSITNIGVVDLKKYSNDKIIISNNYMIPLYQPLLPYSIMINEMNNRIEIVLITNEKFINDNGINEMFNKINEML